MHFTVDNPKKLKDVFTVLIKVVAKSGHMPVLQHVKVLVSEGAAYIEATDLETTIRADISEHITVHKRGSVLIPALPIAKILKSIKTPFDVRKTEKDSISVGPLTLGTISNDEWPQYPGGVHHLNIAHIPDLAARLKTVSYAGGTVDPRYALNGVLFNFGYSHLVGTDGHRLTAASLGAVAWGKHIIPMNTVKVLQGLKTPATVGYVFKGMESEPMAVTFRYPGLYIYSRPIAGNYPDYWQIIPKEKLPFSFTVERETFLKKLDAVHAMSMSRSGAVNLYFRSGDLVMYAENPDIGDIREAMPCETNAELDAFGVNGKYLIDCLKRITADKVTVSFSDKKSITTITTADDSRADVRLVMPIQDRDGVAACDKLYVTFREAPRDVIQAMRLKRRLARARARDKRGKPRIRRMPLLDYQGPVNGNPPVGDAAEKHIADYYGHFTEKAA